MANDKDRNLPAPYDDGFLASRDLPFYFLLPAVMLPFVDKIPGRYFELTESELREAAFYNDPLNRQSIPDETTAKLRYSFWEQYDRVVNLPQTLAVPIDMLAVCRGVCLPSIFYRRIATDAARLAWVLSAPTEYKLSLSDIHDLGNRAMRYALTLPIVNARGEPNVKLLEIQKKIWEHIDMRLKGAIIQRIDQRNLNMNMNMEGKADESTNAKANEMARLSMSELDEKLKLLEEKSRRLMAPSSVQVDLMKNISPQPEPVTIDISEEKEEAGGD